jgi:hypothetical protein
MADKQAFAVPVHSMGKSLTMLTGKGIAGGAYKNAWLVVN